MVVVRAQAWITTFQALSRRCIAALLHGKSGGDNEHQRIHMSDRDEAISLSSIIQIPHGLGSLAHYMLSYFGEPTCDEALLVYIPAHGCQKKAC